MPFDHLGKYQTDHPPWDHVDGKPPVVEYSEGPPGMEEAMKMRERDRRPKYQFEPGDIVEFHGSVREASGSKGIVLEVSPHQKGQGFQVCLCAFAGRDVDLYRQARMYISCKTASSPYSFGAECINTKLVYKEKAPREWLKSITTKEVRTMRFIKILEDD